MYFTSLVKYNRDRLIFPHEEKFVIDDLNNSQNNLVELLDEDDLDQDQEVNQRLIGNFLLLPKTILPHPPDRGMVFGGKLVSYFLKPPPHPH